MEREREERKRESYRSAQRVCSPTLMRLYYVIIDWSESTTVCLSLQQGNFVTLCRLLVGTLRGQVSFQ